MQLTTPSTPWIAHCQPNPKATTRLFCFPFAGGSAQSFRTWADGLPPSIEVCPIELPGRGTRMGDPLCTQLNPLLTAIAKALVPYLDLPFAFFGHSMGAMLAFELTRLLRAQYGAIPVHLFVSGRDAPQIQPSPETKPVHTLPEDQFLEKLKNLSTASEAVLENPEMRQLLIPILRADLELAETYSYSVEAPLECPITAFGGVSDPVTNREELEAWQAQTSGQFALHQFPGDHFFIQSAQSMLLRTIARSL